MLKNPKETNQMKADLSRYILLAILLITKTTKLVQKYTPTLKNTFIIYIVYMFFYRPQNRILGQW